MASVNRVTILGNLGRDPETKYTASGEAVTNISVATTEKWKDKSGEKQEKTEWHRITLFARLAEIAGEYLRSGSQVYIEGRLQTREYEKDGIKRYATEIIADRLQLIGGKDSAPQRPKQDKPDPNARRGSATVNAGADSFDDCPF